MARTFPHVPICVGAPAVVPVVDGWGYSLPKNKYAVFRKRDRGPKRGCQPQKFKFRKYIFYGWNPSS